MWNRLVISVVSSIILYCGGCVDLTIPDISAIEVELVSPGGGVSIDTTFVIFLWEEPEKDLRYQLRVFSGGSFDSPDYVVTDTVIYNNSIEFELLPGAYSWGVRAVNDYFETQFTSSNFTILDDKDDRDQIRLLFPVNGQVLVDSVLQFNWNTELIFDEYILTIEELPVLSAITKDKFLLRAFPNENATYNWSVKGVLTGENTFVESDVFSFEIRPDE